VYGGSSVGNNAAIVPTPDAIVCAVFTYHVVLAGLGSNSMGF
jgi:hypothetical protein